MKHYRDPHEMTIWYSAAGAASLCYWEELMLLKCELMLLKCQISTNTNRTVFLLPTKCLEGVLKYSYLVSIILNFYLCLRILKLSLWLLQALYNAYKTFMNCIILFKDFMVLLSLVPFCEHFLLWLIFRLQWGSYQTLSLRFLILFGIFIVVFNKYGFTMLWEEGLPAWYTVLCLCDLGHPN